MRIVFAAIFALLIGTTINSAHAASKEKEIDRWCVVYDGVKLDSARHCYFHTLTECRKVISEGGGACQSSEFRGVKPR